MCRKLPIFVSCLATVALVAPTPAQENIHPTKMQSPEQQRQDDAQCFTWAVQQSGYDPAKPWFAPQVWSPTPAAGSSVRARSGDARSITRHDAGDAAVAGAIVGASAKPEAAAAAAAILGRDAVNAIPGGAVAGAMVQRDAARNPAWQQEQAASQQQQTGYALFRKARVACLETRGYTAQ
jgi:hypothetical protein